MSSRNSIRILGGGLAGLTLGIALRQRGLPVTLVEAGEYPRHRVCGEFISGRGQETLARLGLEKWLSQAGAVPARTVAFYSANRALCLSRYILDAALAEHFRALGGELLTRQRFPAGEVGEGIVRATGRRPGPAEAGLSWFGLKIHARQVPLAADLELHFSPRGYVGLCRISEDEINVCGLFRKTANDPSVGLSARELLRGLPGSPLHNRLAGAVWDNDSFCAVAGLSLRPHRAAARAELSVGDAITMIPPVIGNGMSMAFESAELAVEPLTAWHEGRLNWHATRQAIHRTCDHQFAARLRWAAWLQRLVLTPSLQNPLIAVANYSDSFGRLAFTLTR